MRGTLRHGDLVGPATIHFGVPYSVTTEHRFVEDRGLATRIPDDTVTELARVYLLDVWHDPMNIRVLDAITGKIYKISPEALNRATWTRLGA